MSRRICIGLYEAIIKIRPLWHSADDDIENIKFGTNGQDILFDMPNEKVYKCNYICKFAILKT